MKEILITSSVLIVAMILLRLMFRSKVSRRLIYGAWLLVALRLLVPIQFGNLNFSVLTPAEPVINSMADIAQRPVSGPSREDVYSDALRDYLSQSSPIFVPEVQAQIDSALQHGRPEQEVYDELLGSNKPESILLPEINREIETKVSQNAAPTIGQIAVAVWITGMAAMAAWFAVVNLSFRRKLQRSATVLNLSESKVPVKVSPVLTSPCLFGLWKPTVYVTPGCVGDERMRHHVLTHELTHLRHGDHVWSWVRCLCLCIYWFNPLVWVAASLSRRDCELACDEAVLKQLGEGERLAYGKTLLDMVSSIPAPGQLLETATAMHETKKQLKERMKCIVKKPKVFLTAAIILLMVLTGLVGCTFSGALDGPTGTTPGNTQPTTVPNTTTAPNPTVVPPTTAVPPTSVPELSTVIVQEMFTYNEEVRKPYYFALGCEFANPKEIVLYNFFRGGWGPGTATDAEKEELKQYYNESWLERAKIYRLPKARMNGELQKYFGISLEDLPDTAFRYLTYLESSDCYCYVGTDSNVYVRNYTVQSVENQDDGTVKVEYTYSEPTLGTHIMFLKHNGRDFQILSNRHSVFDDPELNFFNDLFSTDDPTQRNYYFWATGHTYSSPTQINLKKYFDGGFSDETEITDEEREGLAKLTISQGALNVDCNRLPKDKMNAELMEAFGITLADLPQSAYEGLFYLESTDCYYIIQGGMTSVPKHSPLYEIEHNDDGTVSLTYNIPGGTGKITLKPNGDDYLILSNIHDPVII